MYPSLYDGGTCSLLKPQLSTVHHRAKDSQASRTNILTAMLDSCKEERREWIKREGGRERERDREREGESEREREGEGERERRRGREGERGRERERESGVTLNFASVQVHLAIQYYE